MRDIHKLAKKVVYKYSTNNPFVICKALNIVVSFEDLGEVRGIYFLDKRKKFIHINRNLDPNIQRQVCAHELGHALLHNITNTVFLDTCTYINVDKLEVEANTFAAELLIGDDELIQYKEYSHECLACIFGVHEKLVEYKTKNYIY